MTKRMCAAVFLGFFALYVYTMSPSLAAYRDTGEMVVSAHTLGISHPPSYPLYVLLGRIMDFFPLGNDAYVLGLLSAAAGAGAVALLFGVIASVWGPWAGASAACLLGTQSTFWNVSTVQEMYSLTVLFAVCVLGLAFALEEKYRQRLWFCAVFLFGLFLGNRTDILLWLPGILLWTFPRAFSRWDLERRFHFLWTSAGLGLLGLTVYFYLPLRSLKGPWLDWNHPALISNFIGSLTRRGYGGTLDLLSKNYAAGAMFWANLKVYGQHVWQNFSLIGLFLVALGIWKEARTQRRRFIGIGVLYAASGPLFLFLANMPPNPHAMAIVEPHYLLSDILLVVWAAAGVAALGTMNLPARTPALAAVLLFLQPWLLGRYAQMNRRWDLVGYDHVGNVFRSTPPGSIVITKKDVQIFSLWYYQRIRNRRLDLHILPQGVAHSPWFRDSQKRFGQTVRARELKTHAGWSDLAAAYEHPIYATMDTEIPTELQIGSARGLVMEVFPQRDRILAAPSDVPWNFFIRRGDYRYEHRPEFFTSDLIGDHASARQRLASSFVQAGKLKEARHSLLDSWAMKWQSPETGTYLGYIYMSQGDTANGRRAYELADLQYDQMMALAKEYYTLPGVTHGILKGAADSRLNLGVVYEKTGELEAAERMYHKVLRTDPTKAQAHFNIAVLYWKRDWNKVITSLESALRIDPKHAQSLQYLPIARAHLARKTQ